MNDLRFVAVVKICDLLPSITTGTLIGLITVDTRFLGCTFFESSDPKEVLPQVRVAIVITDRTRNQTSPSEFLLYDAALET